MKRIRKLLFRSFDDHMNKRDQDLLKKHLTFSDELKKEKAELELIRSVISKNEEYKFKPHFSDRVMSAIKEKSYQESYEETFFQSLIGLFKPVAIGAMVLLIVMMSYNIFQNKKVSFSNAVAIPEINVEVAFDPVLPLILE